MCVCVRARGVCARVCARSVCVHVCAWCLCVCVCYLAFASLRGNIHNDSEEE